GVSVESSQPQGDGGGGEFTASNNGEAGAVDLLGRKDGLPPAISGHNNYWLWGPRGYTGQVLLVLGGTTEDHLESRQQVEQAGTANCKYCMPYEDDLPIFV